MSTTAWKPKKLFSIKITYLSVSADFAAMFCKQFLAYAVQIDESAFLSNP